MILVVGATGLVGTEICQRLARTGESVRALVRKTSAAEKIDALRSSGVEICTGDLKDSASLETACRGADAVISTASSTLSRQAGDSIESVDAQGQLTLVNAAKAAKIDRFVFVSFRSSDAITFPLADAKRAVERAISGMNFTSIQASYFMEVWLGPALGFDHANATARIYGSGTAPVSWVSFRDVAQMAAIAVRHPAAERKTIEFGGPEALPALEVVRRFERIGGRTFAVEHIPDAALRAQHDAAADSMQKTFAGLMLAAAYGDAIDMTDTIDTFGLQLTTVDEYARSVLGSAATAS
jgi:uncharacterized protein YbjT (DUF2867 family)